VNVLDLLLPATAHIACQNERHRLRWERGEFTALDHDDIEGELALAALGGEPIRCAELVTAWQQAEQDLRVLVLASRGASDQLNPPAPEDFSPPAGAGMPTSYGWYSSSAPMPMPMAMPMPMPRAAMRGLATPGRQYVSTAHRQPGHEMPREDPLLQLMRLPGGVPDRLVAMVVSHWVALLADSGAPVSASAALSVALGSRVSLAVQTWLGSTGTEVEVELLAPDAPRYLERVGTEADESLRVGLPFSWLSDVWLTGLTHLLGRFTLAAEYIDDAVILDTADTALNRRTLTLSGARP
jgi:hypothetical protein